MSASRAAAEEPGPLNEILRAEPVVHVPERPVSFEGAQGMLEEEGAAV